MADDDAYPWITWWCRRMGSFPYYIKDEHDRARADKAPARAIFKCHPCPDHDGPTWHTVDEITNPMTRWAAERAGAFND